MTVPTALSLRGVSKTFARVQVVRNIALSVRPGEIRGLVGQNGSGKSTLIKIISGYHSADPGSEVTVNGEAIDANSASWHAGRTEVAVVHQDLGLIENLSILDNLFLTPTAQYRHRWRVDRKRERRVARELLQSFRLEMDPEAIVATLGPTERSVVAIIRAINRVRENIGRTPVLLLDEPTTHLTAGEVAELFHVIQAVAARGAAILFVSHQLEEMFALTDSITVIRDGAVVGEFSTAETNEQEVTTAILGRELERRSQRDRVTLTGNEPAMSIEGLEGNVLRRCSIELARGEVLGVAGVAGSGHEELPHIAFGARRPRTGEIRILGRLVGRVSPRGMIRRGVVFLPADRQGLSSVQTATVRENVMLPSPGRFFAKGFLHHGRERAHTRRVLQEFNVTPGRTETVFAFLSGGNQQKALLAKWFETDPKVLLFDEVTQGLDIAAREEVYRLIRAAAARGQAVLMCSSEFEHVAAVCDRVLVFTRGRLAAELTGEEVSAHRIAQHAYAGDLRGVV